MAQSIKQHVDFSVGYRPQEITFIYVKDLVQAVFCHGKRYHRTRIFHQRWKHIPQYGIQRPDTHGARHPFMLRIKAPVWFLRVVCAINGSFSTWRGRTTTLNRDKFHILCQRNWQCDIQPTVKELDFRPEYPLARGVKETIAWYKKEGWL